MAGLLGILNLGGSALRASQRGLATTTHNIGNAQTPGFTRQRAVQSAVETGGVDVEVVQRLRDRFAERELEAGREAVAFAEARSDWLGRVEEAFDESEVAGVGSALGELFNAFRALAATPRDGAVRARVRDAAAALSRAFASAAERLEAVRQGIEEGLPGALAEVNGLAARAASLGAAIVRAEASGAPANDLRDQRDEVVRQIVEKTGGQVLEGPKGVTVLVAGRPLVEGDRASTLGAVPGPGGASVVLRDPSGNAQDVTAWLTRGTLGAMLEVRDRVLPEMRGRLDALALEVVTRVNEVHRSGAGLDGVSGRDLFAPLAGTPGAASALAVAPAVLASTDAIAASADPADPADNRNALALAAVGDEARAALGGARMSSFWARAAGDAGRLAADARGMSEAAAERAAQAQALRDQVSGVSVDEEMIQVVELQAAFQGAAKMVGVVDQLLDTLMKI